MSLIGRLFGSEKAVDGVYNGIDKAIYTTEEKADFFLKLLKAYEPFKLAQRLLALIVGIPYVTVWVVCAALFVISVVMEPCAADLICRSNTIQAGAKELADWNNQTLGTPFSIILAFYFGGGAVEGVLRQVTERSKGR